MNKNETAAVILKTGWCAVKKTELLEVLKIIWASDINIDLEVGTWSNEHVMVSKKKDQEPA
jgi:hypothetical protein